ncbi:DUF4123 domain-containing protein [Duganella sp. CF458]|uniref:DUF4123 domain-containing protein n=1 Tax=Duganella sp. CF458 TaxID=1884368 RepID=UPI001480A675|nr:DUF4123 domain-containing protein [Duganella sp. CF458]
MKEFLEHWETLPQAVPLHLYAIVDSAQDASLLAALHKATPETQSECLLPDAQGPELSKAAPHLVALPPFVEELDAWRLIARRSAANPACVTVIASPLRFSRLHAQLAAFTEVVLPDGDEMHFAFWDPVILGTLVGQKSDSTLHVTGPVLTARQRSKLLTGVQVWWYWGRDGKEQQIIDEARQSDADQVVLPLKLAPVQLEMLIEASVPDHLRGYIKQNQPMLMHGMSELEQYLSVKRHLLSARRLNLRGMQDLINYICAEFIYGEQMRNDSVIIELLGKVKSGEITLAKALEQFP